MPDGRVSQSYLLNGTLASSPRGPFNGLLQWAASIDDPAVERTGNTGFYLREPGLYVVTASFHVRVQFDAPVAWHGMAAGAIAFQGGTVIGV